MRMNPTIMKFGGTSVEDANAFRNVAKIVLAAADASPVVVVSAISGFTNSLLKSVDRAFRGDPRNASRSIEPDFARHVAIAGELLNADATATFEQALAAARAEIRQLHRIIAAHPVTTPPLQYEIVAYGEQLSSQRLPAVLREPGLAARQIDARRCIKTDESYGTASPLPESEQSTRNEVLPLLESSKTPVLGGFIGSTMSGVTTTLGRGGSDYTAALVGAALDAREIQIWTDVSGVLTADPRVVPSARPIPRLSRSEEHTSELQSQSNLVCRLLLEKKKKLRTELLRAHA